MTTTGERRCWFCGTTRARHRLANYADGPNIGAPVLICPTSVFTLPEDGRRDEGHEAEPAANPPEEPKP